MDDNFLGSVVINRLECGAGVILKCLEAEAAHRARQEALHADQSVKSSNHPPSQNGRAMCPHGAAFEPESEDAQTPAENIASKSVATLERLAPDTSMRNPRSSLS